MSGLKSLNVLDEAASKLKSASPENAHDLIVVAIRDLKKVHLTKQYILKYINLINPLTF